MKIEITKSFEDYIAAGDQSIAELLKSDNPLVAELQRHLMHLAEVLRRQTDTDPIVALMSANAYTLFMRTARWLFGVSAAAPPAPLSATRRVADRRSRNRVRQ